MPDSPVGINIGGTAAAMSAEWVPAIVALAEAVQANAAAVQSNAAAIETIARHIEGTPAVTNTTVSGANITMPPAVQPVAPKRRRTAHNRGAASAK